MEREFRRYKCAGFIFPANRPVSSVAARIPREIWMEAETPVRRQSGTNFRSAKTVRWMAGKVVVERNAHAGGDVAGEERGRGVT